LWAVSIHPCYGGIVSGMGNTFQSFELRPQ
jgi:hypothetical protein